MNLRPTVRRDPPDDGVEVRVTEDDATRKGAKRKRAPPTKGPCEHGVKWRSKCKVCGACPHGCPHGRQSAQSSVQGVRWVSICEHGRQRHLCKECGGSQICDCKECGGGASICEHGRHRS